MLITAFNPETNDLEKTYLSSFSNKNSTSFAVKNNDNFTVGRKILIGNMGSENAEALTISSVNSNKLEIVSTSGSKFDHNSDEPVYELDCDKIRFYRATSEGGTYSLQTTVDIDFDNADNVTVWDDTSALSTYFYKVSFYDSISMEESGLSDPIPATGHTRKTIGSIVDGVVRRVRDVSFSVLSFEEYVDIANEVGDDLSSQSQRPYGFLRSSVALDTVANQNYIDIGGQVSDFMKFDYVEVDRNITGTPHDYKQITPLSIEQWNQKYSTGSTQKSDRITDVAFDEQTKRLYIYGTPANVRTGKIILHYYKIFSVISGPADIVETPNPTIYRYKFLAEFYSAKSEADKQWARLADRYEIKYENEKIKMQRMNRLDVGTPRSFRPARATRIRRYRL